MKLLVPLLLLTACGTDLKVKVYYPPDPEVTACKYEEDTNIIEDYMTVKRSLIPEGYTECVVIED
jgi:hypothetical protein